MELRENALGSQCSRSWKTIHLQITTVYNSKTFFKVDVYNTLLSGQVIIMPTIEEREQKLRS